VSSDYAGFADNGIAHSGRRNHQRVRLPRGRQPERENAQSLGIRIPFSRRPAARSRRQGPYRPLPTRPIWTDLRQQCPMWPIDSRQDRRAGQAADVRPARSTCGASSQRAGSVADKIDVRGSVADRQRQCSRPCPGAPGDDAGGNSPGCSRQCPIRIKLRNSQAVP
jgi:hypothetical protein